MGKIATLNEAMQIAGNSTAATSQICATKKDAIEVGCKVSGTYQEQQLVQKTDLSKNKTICTVRASASGRQVKVDCKFAVASDLTVSCIINNELDVDVVVKKGNFTAVKAIGITVSRATIIRLSPIEDSTYIYSIIDM